jgi:hypothetical protein
MRLPAARHSSGVPTLRIARRPRVPPSPPPEQLRGMRPGTTMGVGSMSSRSVAAAALLIAVACTTATTKEEPPPSPTVPHITGMSLAQARRALPDGLVLLRSGFSDRTGYAPGTVVEQHPKPDTVYDPDVPSNKVRVIVSVQTVVVPDVTGLSVSDAKTILTRRTLRVSLWKVPSTQPKWSVLSQSIAEGKGTVAGGRIRLKVAFPALCGSPLNPWCYSVTSVGSLIGDPPARLCDYLDCISSFWSSTNGYVIPVEDWTLDAAGRMTGASYAKAGQASLGALNFGYDAAGQRTTVWGRVLACHLADGDVSQCNL